MTQLDRRSDFENSLVGGYRWRIAHNLGRKPVDMCVFHRYRYTLREMFKMACDIFIFVHG